jgi:hypothetical protein
VLRLAVLLLTLIEVACHLLLLQSPPIRFAQQNASQTQACELFGISFLASKTAALYSQIRCFDVVETIFIRSGPNGL